MDTFGEAGAAEGSGDDLVVTATRSEEISELTMLSTEAVGGVMALEASPTSDPAFDAAMVLLEPVVQVGAGAVPDGLAQHGSDRPGVGAVTVRRHLLRPEAHGRPRRAEEGLRRLHVAMLAQHGVDQVAVPIDRSIQVAPAAADLQIRLIDVPPGAAAAPPAMPALAQLVAHDRQQLCLPVTNSLVADLDPAQGQDLAQVAQGQPVAEPAEHHEGDDVAGQAGPVQHAGTALVELPSTDPAAEAAIATSRDLRPLSHRRRSAVNTVHAASPFVEMLSATLA